MDGRPRNQGMGCDLARKGRLVVAAALMSVLLTACGGDSDSSAPAPAAAAAAPTSSAPASVEGSAQSATAIPTVKGSATLSWTPPTTNDDGTPLTLTGYRIYWGESEGHYPHSVTVSNPGLTRYVVEQLPPATWYFVATALSADGESPPSNAIAMQVL
jgi:Fibronectin type III domain